MAEHKLADYRVGLGFDIDKTGLKQFEQALKDIQQMKTVDFQAATGNKNYAEAQNQLRKLQDTATSVSEAMQHAFNPSLNSLNLTKFNEELARVGLSSKEIMQTFGQAGAQGQTLLTGFANQTLTANIRLKETNKIVADIGKTLYNSFKYTMSYGLINSITDVFKQSFEYVKALDASLNDIRIVTDKSATDMERFAANANKAAKELGKSTMDYTKASLIYYQQGLSDEEVAARTETTLKIANVTSQSTQQVSEQLTAVWNGYKVSAQEAELYVDKLAAVAATTASDLEELSTGMSKVASAAANMGVDVDQLNAMLSTITSVTRQAPESVGTSLRTILARMGDLKINGEDEFGVSLGEVSGQLAEIGVQILDVKGNLREMGQVVEEVGEKWNSGVWSDAEKQAIAIELAGKRQYNALVALFDNWDMYQSSLTTSIEAQGTLQKQQDTYMQSTAAHLQQMQTAWEGVKSSLIKSNDVNPLIDGLGKIGEVTEKAIDGIDGMKGAITLLASVALQAFAPQLANGLNQVISNTEIASQRTLELNDRFQTIAQLRPFAVDNEDIRFLIDDFESIQSSFANLDETIVNGHLKKLESAVNARIELQNLTQETEKMAQVANLVSDKRFFSQQFFDNCQEAYEELSKITDFGTSEFKTLYNELLSFTNRGIGNATLGMRDNLEHASDLVETLRDNLKGLEQDTKLSFNLDIIEQYTERTHLTAEEVRTLRAALREVISTFDEYGQVADRAMQLQQDGINKTEQEVQNLTNIVKESRDELSNLNNVVQIGQLLSGFSQLGLSINSIGNAFSRFKQEDFLGGFTSLAMSSGMLINVYKNLEKSLGIVNQRQTQSAALAAKQIATEKLHNTENAINIAYQTKKNALLEVEDKELALINAKRKEQLIVDTTSAEAWEAALEVKAAELELEKAINKQKTVNTDFTKLLNRYRKEEKELVDATAQSNKKYMTSLLQLPYAGVIAGIGAVIAALSIYLKYVKETNEAVIEQNNKASEILKNNIQEAQSLEELKSSYDELLKKYKESGEESDDLKEKALELCDKYDLQSEKILALTGQYDELAKKIEHIQSISGTTLNSATELINRSNASANAQAYNNQSWLNRAAAEVASIFGTSKDNDLAIKTGILGTKDNVLARQLISQQAGYTYSQFDGSMHFDFKDANDAYEKLGNMLKVLEQHKLTLTSAYQSISEQYANMAQYADNFNQGIEAQNQSIINRTTESRELQNFNEELVYSDRKYQDFVKKVQSFRDKIVGEFEKEGITRSSKEIDQIVADYINNLNNAYSVRYQIIDKLSKATGDTIRSTDELNDKLSKYSNEELSYLVQLGFSGSEDEKTIKKALDLMPESGSGIVNLEYIIKVREAVTDKNLSKTEAKEYAQNLRGAQGDNPEAYAGFEYRGSGNQLDIVKQTQTQEIKAEAEAMLELLNVEEAESKIKERRAQAVENETDRQTELNEALEKAGSFTLVDTEKNTSEDIKYSELQKRIDDDKLALSHELDEATRKQLETRIALEEDALKQLYEDNDQLVVLKELYDNATNAVADFDEQLEQLDKINPLEQQQKAFENIQESIKTTIADIQKLSEAGELIAANFQVPADSVQKLAAIYPELLEGATAISEDMVQLDKTRVQEFINNRKEEVNAEIDSKIEQLNIEKEILTANLNTHKKRLEILEKYIAGKADATETENALVEEQTKYEDTMKKIVSDHEIDILDISLLNQSNTIKAEIDNLEQLFNAYNSVGAAAMAALSGEEYKGSFNRGGTTSSTDLQYAEHEQNLVDAGKKLRENEEELFNKAKQIAANERQEVALLEAEISSLDQSIAQLTATKSKVNGVWNRVSSGKAGKKSNKSGSSSQPDKKDLLKEREELDVFHDIDLALADIAHQLKMIQKEEKKAFGLDYINNLNKQIKLLEKQKQLQKDKLKLAQQEAATRRAALAAEGVSFDASGYMTNYMNIMKAKLDHVNSLITAYNAMSAAEQKANKQAVEDAKKDYNDLKKQISEYDKLISNTIPQFEESLEDALNQQIELQIKAFNYEIDVRLDMAQARRDWNDFYKQVVLDIEGIADPVKKIITGAQASLADFRSYYEGRDGWGSIQYLTEHVGKVMKELDVLNGGGISDVYGDDRASAVADLKKYNDELMNGLKDAQKLINDVKKSYLDGIDAAKEKLDKHKEQYEYIADILQHGVNLTELLGGPDSYETLGKYYSEMQFYNTKNLEFLRMEKEALKAQLDSVEKGSEAWKKLYEQYQNNIKDLNAALEESLKNVISKYENAINTAFDKYNRILTGNIGLDYAQRSYDRDKDVKGDYLDQVNAQYAMADLRNKYQKAINDTTSLDAQRKLNDLMDQELAKIIAINEEGERANKISQYEVERAEKMLELELKKIALQEAQANKSQLRLRRDSQGNYTYQYTADQDAINDAEADLNKAANDLYNFDLNHYDKILSQATELTKKYEEEVSQILLDTALGEVERTQLLEEVKDAYYTKMQDLEDQLYWTKLNLGESAKESLIQSFDETSNYFNQTVWNQIVPGWNGALDDMITHFTDQFYPDFENTMDQIKDSTEQYKQDLKDLEEAAGVDFKYIQDYILATTDYTYKLMDSNYAVIDSYNQEMDAIRGVVQEMERLIAAYREATDAAIRMAEEACKAWKQVQLTATNARAEIEKAAQADALAAQRKFSDASNLAGGTGGGGGGSSQQPTITVSPAKDCYWKVVGSNVAGIQGGPVTRSEAVSQANAAASGLGSRYRVKKTYWSGQTYIVEVEYVIGSYTVYSNGIIIDNPYARRAAGFATGGYTGSWGSEGKFAMLHEKELVLNKDDTANILSVVDIVRSLASSVNGRIAAIGASAGIGQVQNGVTTMEQQVHIEANFPGVTSHSEIEQAFENLVNMASQHAFDTRD